MSPQESSSERARGEIGGLRPAMRFLAPYKKQITGALIALVFTALVTLSIGQGLRLLIDRGFATGSPEQLNVAILVFFSMVGLLAAGTFIRFYLVSWIGERVVADIRKAVFNHIIDLHPGFFEENGSGEIQTRLTTDTTLLQTVIGSSVSIALRNALMFIGGLIWMFFTDPKLTSIVLLSVPLVILPIVFFGRRVRTLSRSSQDRVADVGSYVGEALKNIKTVQAFNHQPHDRDNFSRVVEGAFDVAIRRISQRSWLTAAVIVLVLGAVAVMLWVGGHDVLAGRLTSGELVAFIFYAVMVAGSVGAISEVYGDLQRAAGATERLMELLHADSLITAPLHPQKLPGRAAGSLVIEGLRFWYPSRPDTPAIDGLDLQVAPGTRVALVGTSGAGKSTLFDLLLRFYAPQEGVIRLDGIDISQLDPADLRSHIAIVPQQPTLFTGNVLENIRYGCPQATEAQVMAAARAAHAHEFIERLPQGYQSFLGEGGVRLSGGQRQRIAIARAILLDPELLLLDEATSALDAESEFVVQQALEELMKGRTSLVIAHRLATVVDVERIVVLDHGRIVATGTHRELLSRSPLYARWAELQFGEAALAAG
ncbi:MAG: ATP-binding cassette domain-containing protein [Gammaproteobacteria bacterium]|nr:MAG: ATP-binding cassette domain-containing protein [Gammaproteobacteria bacterium]